MRDPRADTPAIRVAERHERPARSRGPQQRPGAVTVLIAAEWAYSLSAAVCQADSTATTYPGPPPLPRAQPSRSATTPAPSKSATHSWAVPSGNGRDPNRHARPPSASSPGGYTRFAYAIATGRARCTFGLRTTVGPELVRTVRSILAWVGTGLYLRALRPA